MEQYPSLPSKRYHELRHEIRSGDILLCSGNSVFSTLIKKATNSVWSHVGFILRLDAIERIMVLESVESIGVRAIPLSNYVHDYNATGKGYEGKLMLARHQDVREENISKLSRSAVDLLGYPYRTEEIVHIAARLGFHTLGLPGQKADAESQRAFICSEYAYTCFKSIGVTINYNTVGFISPDDFARHEKVEPICFIESEAGQRKPANLLNHLKVAK
ncbi:hypothetical protein AQUSIP_03190 [Aquicella siphonis]|uniref:Permuted papain-like amidase YaeF/Yiix C92 family enzyme n=1 Tax=Aquicella siphonis TaxID=254247 RepID=A0A5E4PE06_9COXI|nr:YiiX/YebB-like N1pC/P60 family cysteine hydrolase [Aquicella siphonis]VVC75044.1 hypothetical protein AQUSIP_03190 [Aquicella siphonis]